MNRIVLVSNRVQMPDGRGVQPGGLAVALGDLIEKRGGLWFGWNGQVSDDARVVATATQGKMQYATVALTREEHDRYYNDFANATLWPLLHSLPENMNFDRRSAQVYRQVNARLTDTLVPLLRPTDLIWIHDYHLMAMPARLRARGVAAPIGFFLHIPFPPPEMFSRVPEAAALVRDLLAADLLGFQTDEDAENFANAATQLAGATRLDQDLLRLGGRRVRLGAFPVEIEAREFAAIAEKAWRSPDTERLRRSLGGQALIFGVDRMDPTKGLPQRLQGFRRLLETHPDWRRRVTFLQIAAGSRQDVEAYQELRETIEQEAGAINAEWGEPDWTPLRIMSRGVPRNVMAGYMRESKTALVTPLRDGMNLVAKEYVASQDPQDPGVLVLSRFAGAARQLEAALLVNPHDADALAEATDRALTMKLAERKDRWQHNWAAIADATPEAWGRRFLDALAASTAAPRSVVASSGTADREAGELTPEV